MTSGKTHIYIIKTTLYYLSVLANVMSYTEPLPFLEIKNISISSFLKLSSNFNIYHFDIKV